MSEWTRDERVVLRRVVEAARRELRDREPEAIPARLTKVARSSARTLPPPLEQALVVALVDDPDFRATVAERYEPPPGGDPVGEVFLEDPAAARDLARAAVAEASERADRTRQDRDRRRIEELEAELSEAKDRLAAARRSHEEALADLRERDRTARTNLIEEARRLRREVEDVSAAAERASEGRDRWEERAVELEAALASERERRRRDAGDGARATIARTPFTVTDPGSLARHLDLVERTARPYRRSTAEIGDGAESQPLALPSGVLPDAADAIDALASLGPDLILIDGYNLAGVIDSAPFHTRAGRDRVMPGASALRRLVGAAVVIVFDATDVEGRSGSRSVDGIDIVFAQERSADDEIVGIVAAGDARTVVVTNDRELRERCAMVGALPIWSDAVVAWLNR